MGKYYSRINWQNSPSKTTPISAENLNKMDKAIEDLDNEAAVLRQEINDVKSYVSKDLLGGAS